MTEKNAPDSQEDALMNCPHSSEGWCLSCAAELRQRIVELQASQLETGKNYVKTLNGLQQTINELRASIWECPNCGFEMHRRHFDEKETEPCPVCSEAKLAAQLPETMQHCTIIFKECEKGHGRLTATNWTDHGCETCERDKLQAEVDIQRLELKSLRALKDAAEDDCEHFNEQRAKIDELQAQVKRQSALLHSTAVRQTDEYEQRLKAILASANDYLKDAELTRLQRENERLAILAQRCYPGLHHSGHCSHHQADGHFECSVCYPNWPKLAERHAEVNGEVIKERDALHARLARLDAHYGEDL